MPEEKEDYTFVKPKKPKTKRERKADELRKVVDEAARRLNLVDDNIQVQEVGDRILLTAQFRLMKPEERKPGDPISAEELEPTPDKKKGNT